MGNKVDTFRAIKVLDKALAQQRENDEEAKYDKLKYLEEHKDSDEKSCQDELPVISDDYTNQGNSD